MYDANSKVPSGLLYGRYNDFGDFDECVDFLDPTSAEYRGKYCLGETEIGIKQPVSSCKLF